MPQDPLHVHVGKNTPVHVHVSPKKKSNTQALYESLRKEQGRTSTRMTAGLPSQGSVTPVRSRKGKSVRIADERTGDTVLHVNDLEYDNKMERELEHSRRDIADLNTSVDNLRGSLAAERELNSSRDMMRQSTLNELTSDLVASRKENTSLRVTGESLADQRDELAAKLSRSRVEEGRSREELDIQQNLTRQQRLTIDQLRADLDDERLRVKSLEGELARLKIKNDTIQSESDRVRGSLSNSMRQAADERASADVELSKAMNATEDYKQLYFEFKDKYERERRINDSLAAEASVKAAVELQSERASRLEKERSERLESSLALARAELARTETDLNRSRATIMAEEMVNREQRSLLRSLSGDLEASRLRERLYTPRY